MSWYNNDGLLVKIGTEEATAGKAGSYEWDGPQSMVELVINPLTGLTASAVIQSDVVALPAGAVIQEVHVIADVAATSGGAATLNVGLIKSDRSTNVSDTAVVNAMAITAIDAAGETNKLLVGSTGAGTSMGASVGTLPVLLTAKYGTAAFTAGKVTVRIFYVLNAA